MYCIKCGVELADSEKKCPLCGTVVFNPELSRPDGEPQYPRMPAAQPEKVNHSGIMFVVTMLFMLPIVTTLLCDWQINGKIIWSGYAVGALPVTAAAGLILTAAVTLLKYVRKGYLFIFGGTIILSGAYTVLVEFLLNLNFHVHDEFIWSFYPFSVSFILGVMLIVIGTCRPLRESLHKKFFL